MMSLKLVSGWFCVCVQCSENGFFMPAELPEFENGSGRKILNSRNYIISACVE